MSELFGWYQGIVVDAADPTGQGRVRLVIPQVSGAEKSGWALPIDLDAAKTYLIKPKTVVWVTFEGGSKSHPVYMPPIAPPTNRRLRLVEKKMLEIDTRLRVLEQGRLTRNSNGTVTIDPISSPGGTRLFKET